MNRRSRLASSVISLVAVSLLAACSDAGTPGTGPGNTLTVRGSAGAPPASSVVSATRVSASRGIAHLSADGGSITGTGDPASLSIGMYALYISQNSDCTSPVLVADNGASAQAKDFVGNPVLFTGSPAAGTYKCLMLRMSDVLAFTAATTFGGCHTGVTYTGDIYRDGQNDWKDMDLSPIIGHGTDDAPVDDHVVIFITSDPSAVEARGVSHNQVIALGSDLVVPGQTTFYWNGAGSVVTDGTLCGVDPGHPSFH